MSEQKALFSKVMQVYVPYVRALAASISPRHREDLMQEGFLGLYRACGAYDAGKGATFDGFAKTCIRNQMLGAYRALRKDDSLVDGRDLEEGMIARDCSEIDGALAKDFFRTLRAKLTDTERRVLDEYLKDRSYEDIASALGITPKKVDNALSRIKNKIRLEYNP